MYRSAYECDATARSLGRSLGLCAIELAVRREYGEDLRDLFMTDLPGEEVADALVKLELLLDAVIYHHRVSTWIGIAGNAGSPTFDDPDYARGVARYRMGASERLWRRSAALRPLILEAGHRRKEREFDERLEAMRVALRTRSA